MKYERAMFVDCGAGYVPTPFGEKKSMVVPYNDTLMNGLHRGSIISLSNGQTGIEYDYVVLNRIILYKDRPERFQTIRFNVMRVKK